MKYYFTIFYITIAFASGAQDMHFSHFYAAPLYLNPAMTGNFDGTYRVGGNYKNQWQSVTVPYRTFSVYGDYKFDPFSAGIYFLHDQAGDGKLSTQKIFVSGAYHHSLNELEITLGAGVGFVQKSLDFSKLIFDEQWTGETFDPQLPTNEFSGEQSLNYIDLQGGVVAKYIFSEEAEIYVGTNLVHFLHPDESYYNSGNELGTRSVFHGGGRVPISESIHLEPAMIYMMQKKASEFIVGANAGLDLERDVKTVLLFGVWFRGTVDAVPVVGVEYNNIRGLISYDLNFGKLKLESENRRGIELSIQYIGAVDKTPDILKIPCIRF